MCNKKIQHFLIAVSLFAFILQPINTLAVTNRTNTTKAGPAVSSISPRQLIIGKWSTLFKNQPFYVEFNKNGIVSFSGVGTTTAQSKIKYTLSDIPGSKTTITVKSVIFYNSANSSHNTNSANNTSSTASSSKTGTTTNVAVTVVFKDNNTMTFQGITFIRVKK
jgi:hypothetical protein